MCSNRLDKIVKPVTAGFTCLMKKQLLFFIISLCFASAWGQEEQDSTGTYNNEEGFGGPKTVGAQLQIDNQPKFDYRIPIKVTKIPVVC